MSGMNSGILRNRRVPRGFSLIEILFAIAMLAIGVVAILALFATGIKAATTSGNKNDAAIEAQSLFARILSEEDTKGKRIFLERIAPSDGSGAKGSEWIHCDESFGFANGEEPVRIDSKRELWWKCRVLPVKGDRKRTRNPDGTFTTTTPKNPWKPPMNPDNPFEPQRFDSDVDTDPVPGLYEVAIAIYRNYTDGKEPIAWYTTMVTAGY